MLELQNVSKTVVGFAVAVPIIPMVIASLLPAGGLSKILMTFSIVALAIILVVEIYLQAIHRSSEYDVSRRRGW